MVDVAMHSPGPHASLRGHSVFGVISIAVVLVGLGWWSMATKIAGAVIASGALVVEGGSKQVQHQEGGIVTAVLVKDEDKVDAGQLLLRLDDTTISASLGVISSQLEEAAAQQARLNAEARGLERIATEGKGDTLIGMQQELLEARAASRSGSKLQLQQQIAQMREQIAGLEAQQQAIDGQLAIVADERADLLALSRDGLVEQTRVNAVRREEAAMLGDGGRLGAAIAEARAAIAEREVQLRQIDNAFRAEVLNDLQLVRAKIAELQQQKIAVVDRLSRLDIRAPISGVVHQSIVRTVGGIVGAGDTLMLIVPQWDKPSADIRINPTDVDKVYAGQEVVLRFPNFDLRTTPEVEGNIRTVSPDLNTDATTGNQYYVARVAISEASLAKLPPGSRLLPGMPVEAFVHTDSHTVISYLAKPLMDQIDHTFREPQHTASQGSNAGAD